MSGRNNKRLLILILVIACAFLYACSKSGSTPVNPSEEQTSDGPDNPAPTEEPKVTPYEEKGVVKFSVNGGIYTNAFDLELSAPEGYTIHYTTKGTIPTEQSPVYTHPIRIDNNESTPAGALSKTLSATAGAAYPKENMPSGKIIRAIAVNDETGEKTDVATNTYMVWSEGADLYGCPIISLTVDKKDFAGTEGIYVKYSLTNKPKAVSYCEVFDENGLKRSGSYITIAVSGNGSSGFLQKSLKLSWKSDANPDVEDNKGKLKYDIFDGAVHDVNGAVITSYKRLLVRNSGNDCPGSFIRDRVIQTCCDGMAVSYMAGQTVVMFINGELWGCYNLRERYAPQYFEAHFGVNKDNVVMLEAPSPLITGNGNSPYEVNDGEPGDEKDWEDLVNYISKHDMTADKYYQNVLERLDVDGLIDNFLVNMYFYNGDWPTNNIKVWRNKNPEDLSGFDTKWHFTIVDTDGGLGGDVSANYFGAIGSGTILGQMMAKLMTNSEFKQRFFNRAVYAATVLFTSDRVNQVIDDVVASMEKPYQASLIRWQAMGISEANWRNNISVMHNFATKRPEIFLSQLYNYTGMHAVTLDIGFGGGGSTVTVNGTEYGEGQRVYVGVSGGKTEIRYSVKAKEGYTIETIYYLLSDGTRVDLDKNSGTFEIEESAMMFVISKDNSTAAEIDTEAKLEAGASEVFYLNSNGYLYSWGYSDSYAHGLGNFVLTVPVRILSGVTDVYTSHGGISASSQHTFIVLSDGTVMSAGKNGCGQLARTGDNRIFKPVTVPDGTISSFSCGATHTLLLMEDGSLYGVGSNEYGELKGMNKGNISEWKLIDTGVTSMAAGSHITAYVKNGTLYLLGDNRWKMMNSDALEKMIDPVKIADSVSYCTAADKSVCFIDNDGVLYYVGLRSEEEAFGGESSGSVSKIAEGVASVSIMTDHILFSKEPGTLYGLGNNRYGQINPNMTKTYYSEPYRISEQCIGFSAGAGYSAYTTADGSVITFGNNSYGISGNGIMSDRSEKILINFR